MTTITRRVRLAYDEDNSGPDYDAQMPVIYVEYRGGPSIVHGREYLPDAANLRNAWNYLSRDDFERWLRINVGPIETFSGNDRSGYYIRIAAPGWRKVIGLTDEYLAENGYVMEQILKGPDDWEFFARGEVYGIIVEERVHYVAVDDDGDALDGSDKYEWEHKDSCWGYYGHKYALEAARSDFVIDAETPFVVIDEEGDEVYVSHTLHTTLCDTYRTWVLEEPRKPCSEVCGQQLQEPHDEDQFFWVPQPKEEVS